jgi:eukaryotic-like serine/threonine-protein kinase
MATDTASLDSGDASGPLRAGQAFGPRYHIIKTLGIGGMGAVYQAFDAELNVAVALKVIRTGSRRHAASPQAEMRFKQELLLARQVTHKSVVRIHDLGEIGGIKYITMPYVHGHDLATVLRRGGKMPVARTLVLARQLAAGLQAAHDAGVIHRDLKPANIMIGADDHALIMDFGISASADEATTGGVLGTLEYMAPEQGSGVAVDARADIYAFGLILYEMLTGPRLNTATTPQERVDAMKQRTTKGLPPLGSLDASVPPAVEAVVTRCLERDPAARFQNASELVAALGHIDAEGGLIRTPARISRRLVALVSLLVTVSLVAVYVVGRRAAPPPAAAHEPVSVLIADLQNATNDPSFERTLEPMLKLALEGAGFISAFDRNGITRTLGVRPPDKLDERAAQELAVKQGVGVVLSGSLARQGNGYEMSVNATESVTGNVITKAKERAAGKDQVLAVATSLAMSVRKALGDETSESAQRFATQTFSATSLEVVRAYAAAAESLSKNRWDEALRNFASSVALDPNFGLGYAGMAIVSRNLDKQQDAEKYIKEAVRHLDSMTERERFRTRGLFYYITADYQQCVKEYGELITRYSADAPARNNLALCLTHLRSLPRALGEMREVIKILPKRELYRVNLALYAAYSGDAKTAGDEARALPQTSVFGQLALAFSQLLQSQLPQAAETYQRLGSIDEQGASYAASGLGDLALYEGRLADAVKILTDGATADVAARESDRAANKYVALAYAQALRQQKAAAVAAADRALAESPTPKVRLLAAHVFIEADALTKAKLLADALLSELQAEPQAYGKILAGELALKSGDPRQAIKSLTEANAALDTWLGHFVLGRGFLEAGAFTQADSEFDRCISRRGEALALFLDEEPTFGQFPPVYYYQGRAREGLNTARYMESYRAYLAIRGQSKEDPLLPDARRRAAR